MLPDRVSNPGPLTYESGVLPIALRGPAPMSRHVVSQKCDIDHYILHSPIGDKRFNTNHYKKRFNLHVLVFKCSLLCRCRVLHLIKSSRGNRSCNDKSLHKIVLYFAGFPFSYVT